MVKAVLEPATQENISVPLSAKEEAKRDLKRFMEEESKMVKGRFRSYENPGAREKIHYKKYPTHMEMLKRGETGGVEPFEKWMTDNEVYEIPLYVARHLNGTDVTARALNGKVNSCAYPIHSFLSQGDHLPSSQFDGAGIPIPITTSQKYKRRFGFESLEFGV